MGLRKFAMVVLMVAALGAIAATTASAANEFSETGGAWYVGGSKLGEGTTKPLTTTAAGTQKLATTVGGQKLDLTWTGVHCVGCTIKNTGTTATVDGTFEFTGVSVSEPAGCSTTSTITTKPLTGVMGMNTAGTLPTIKFTPVSGATIAVVEILGVSCPIAGVYKLSGTLFERPELGTGRFSISLELVFSKEIEESAGTATSLKFGENAAIMTGTVGNKLSSEEEFSSIGSGSQYEESSSAWYTGASPGTKLAEGTTKAISAEAATKLTLESTVGGKHFDLTATGLECSGCVIRNVGTKALMEGTLLFKGVTLGEPEAANCSVAGTLETKKLKATVGMAKGSATIPIIGFAPETGTTIATVEISGAKCSVAGTYNLTGVFYAEATNATGVFGKTQPIKLNQAIQESSGSASSMKLGESNAFLTGTANLNAEVEYAAKEK